MSEASVSESVFHKFKTVLDMIESEEIPPTLCFCRKYMSSGKPKYIFYETNMQSEVSEKVGSFLNENIIELERKREVDILEDNIKECYQKIDLGEISNWKIFEENAFIASKEIVDLKKIKKGLNCFIIYYKIDNKIIGQIRSITASSILNQKGYIHRLFFEKNTFNEIREEELITIDELYDFMFLVEFKEVEDESKESEEVEDESKESEEVEDESKESEEVEDESKESEEVRIQERVRGIGIINNNNNFSSIFDLNEQYENEAKEIVSTSTIFNDFIEPSRISEMIANDRTLQRTLRSPVCKKAFEEIKSEDLIEIKDVLEDNVKFDIDGEGKIILPENEKPALKEFIRAVGHYYNRSIYGADPPIIVGKPKEVLTN
jgi:hypothetical protein